MEIVANIFIALVEHEGLVTAIIVSVIIAVGAMAFKKEKKKEVAVTEESILRKEWAEALKSINEKVIILADIVPKHAESCASVNNCVKEDVKAIKKQVEDVKKDVVQLKENNIQKDAVDGINTGNFKEDLREIKALAAEINAKDLKEELKEIKKIDSEINTLVQIVNSKVGVGDK